MSCIWTRAEIEEQIASLKLQLAENTAATAAARKTQTYSLDTSQSRQSVTRTSLNQLRKERTAILSELSTWQSYLCNSTHVRPGW